MLKIQNKEIGFQEVPNYTSLCLSIGGCPYHCDGCHSPWLWEDKGELLLSVIDRILDKYKKLIECVCFMGGDQEEEELQILLRKTKEEGLKTCLYTGRNELSSFKHETLLLLDWIKIGEYNKELGGLLSPTTNQKFFRLENGGVVQEIKFYKEKLLSSSI